ncbi:hypothetical protein BGX34_005727 [Mortierella sp. NVP85]|nr:hypothetical protein BGX34_005727 [Mortierella sp. NVP85]
MDYKAPNRLRVQPEDTFLRDATNRAWLLRGVNLSGSSKFPRYPVPVPSHVRGDAFLKARSSSSSGGCISSSSSSSPLALAASAPPSQKGRLEEEGNENGKVNANELNDERMQQQQPQQNSTKSTISFKGRPFELDEADEHLARLRHWGFRMIRWVVTWEAIEHQGPGICDEEFLDYTVQALLKAKEYGFKVMIDFHQDVWSRFSGGSGAPLWTFYAAGLDPHHFAATGAAAVHNMLSESDRLPRMVWLTNYYKLACATMFTLFYAGSLLAPQCTFDNGVNIQEYLQSHFLGAIRALVNKIHACQDGAGRPLLEDDVVLGYDSWNEPSCGWIGLERLDVLPEQHDMRQGDMPTPLQSLMLGEGMVVQNIATYRLELVGPVKSGSRTINPSAQASAGNPATASSSPLTVKAWLSPELRSEYDLEYGIRRDPGFPKAGTCLWAQHGVWSVQDRKVLQQDYFARRPSPSREQIQWVPDHWLPFAKRVIEVVRLIHPTAILFLEPPVYVPPPDLVSKTQSKGSDESSEILTTNMVYTPHHYDDLVLLTKRYLGWVNIDLLGLSRGRHKSLLGSVVLGKKATETLFGNQIGEIQKECFERLGKRPVLIGETGLHFDVGLDKSLQSGNITNDPFKKGRAPQSLLFAPSKQFQRAFDNILDGLDRTLSHYTLWNYTIENDLLYGDGWNGENLSLFSLDAQVASRTTETKSKAEGNGMGSHKLDHGGRAIEQFCRPYPVATVGQPTKMVFDRHNRSFKLWTRSTGEDRSSIDAGSSSGGVATEIYLPLLHFHGPEKCTIETSDGSWRWSAEQQILFWIYGEDQAVEDHWIEIRRTRC